MPHFFMFEFFEMPHFSHFQNQIGKKIFGFGAFQKIQKMLSHDKILFHMLFGAFHDTPCITFLEAQSFLWPDDKFDQFPPAIIQS